MSDKHADNGTPEQEEEGTVTELPVSPQAPAPEVPYEVLAQNLVATQGQLQAANNTIESMKQRVYDLEMQIIDKISEVRLLLGERQQEATEGGE